MRRTIFTGTWLCLAPSFPGRVRVLTGVRGGIPGGNSGEHGGPKTMVVSGR